MLFGFNPFLRESNMQTHEAIVTCKYSFPKDENVSKSAKEISEELDRFQRQKEKEEEGRMEARRAHFPGHTSGNLYTTTLQTSSRKAPVNPKTLGQKRYVDAIVKHDVTFGMGPAGTGKTFLAMTLAVMALKEEKVSRIILTRPAVEAGEALGFLPGDLYEKLAPYLRPLHDALRRLIKWIYTEVILPTVLRMHRWGVLEALAW